MTIRELIKKLRKIANTHGDLYVEILHNDNLSLLYEEHISTTEVDVDTARPSTIVVIDMDGEASNV